MTIKHANFEGRNGNKGEAAMRTLRFDERVMLNIATTSSTRKNPTPSALSFAALGFAFLTPLVGSAQDWKESAISPVANPLFFESPLIENEVRPVFVYHNIDDEFIGGVARVYAVQIRYAITDRLALIATKDGYIELRPRVTALRADGWADIGAGLKYALIDDPERQFILTPGLKFELPSGNQRVFQGNGKGEINPFVSAMKGWDRLHLTGSVGGRIGIDTDEETSSLHYSLQLDYQVHRWFTPFAVFSGHTVLNEASTLAFGGIEGFDLINFGASDAGGATQAVVGCGFRSRFCKWSDVGFAYEKGVSSPRGLFEDRFTVDFIVRF